ncbi:hypothetical protein [Streptomyces sp. SID8352]|uniref:hypothetical protein n=1 Tax=Streptomyces sp. SID8352 TaxID=2690338 RepID=UPI001368916C|nr:hypothetical protein [Streptomyces sp. SID8352]MYU22033.1 hypothetical protein [Streptomyces sp. SID8352]
MRAALAGILAPDGTGTPAREHLRRELCARLPARERDPAVLGALLRAAAARCGAGDLPVLVHRTGPLLGRTPDGAERLDRALADLARHLPGFAARLAGWLRAASGEWAPLVGPDTRRTVEEPAEPRTPARSGPGPVRPGARG